ncbi:hypothetical protein N7457_001397 [Penicillium paradoxum]|uniref:uncharacterized protein n=1 Tax=Penicillium paradoxum TaxID=176176 RepID=UPI0025472821|nr:uncharacterized protein N7457_001397 [Penicillium paradoxum]KAJ5794798.1 hypothetical protein N7457_001397 [Penicillium paradoxum]
MSHSHEGSDPYRYHIFRRPRPQYQEYLIVDIEQHLSETLTSGSRAKGVLSPSSPPPSSSPPSSPQSFPTSISSSVLSSISPLFNLFPLDPHPHPLPVHLLLLRTATPSPPISSPTIFISVLSPPQPQLTPPPSYPSPLQHPSPPTPVAPTIPAASTTLHPPLPSYAPDPGPRISQPKTRNNKSPISHLPPSNPSKRGPRANVEDTALLLHPHAAKCQALTTRRRYQHG